MPRPKKPEPLDTRQASTNNSPTPHRSTFSATVSPLPSGRRAKIQTSCAGFSCPPLLGQPVPKVWWMVSRISHPASSNASAVQCCVRGRAHVRENAPGFTSRSPAAARARQ
jgi:hypothetical protein